MILDFVIIIWLCNFGAMRTFAPASRLGNAVASQFGKTESAVCVCVLCLTDLSTSQRLDKDYGVGVGSSMGENRFRVAFTFWLNG